MSEHGFKMFKMPEINSVTLAGRLTRDPELTYIASGNALCKFSIAVDRRYKTKAGEAKEDTCFPEITTWSATAE